MDCPPLDQMQHKLFWCTSIVWQGGVEYVGLGLKTFCYTTTWSENCVGFWPLEYALPAATLAAFCECLGCFCRWPCSGFHGLIRKSLSNCETWMELIPQGIQKTQICVILMSKHIIIILRACDIFNPVNKPMLYHLIFLYMIYPNIWIYLKSSLLHEMHCVILHNIN